MNLTYVDAQNILLSAGLTTLLELSEHWDVDNQAQLQPPLTDSRLLVFHAG
jgi:hypothetical protein